MSKRVLIFGSSGMAGHVLTLYLREVSNSTVFDVGPRKKPFSDSILCDLESLEEIKKLIDSIKPDIIVNCTGVLVKASEQNKRQAVWLNAFLPRYLSDLCIGNRIRLIHLSTDCVFSGKSGPYTETSYRDGDAFYDRSKALGEVVDGDDLTIRTSIIGPELKPSGLGLLDWVMRQYGDITGYRRALWSGVTTLELAKYVHFLIDKKYDLTGLVHYSVLGGTSKYELLQSINRVFDRKFNVQPFDEPELDKRLMNTRADIGMEPAGYDKQLHELKKWIDVHYNMYPHYQEQS
jgi:dTDP-4-dehydrorhamnose reductase